MIPFFVREVFIKYLLYYDLDSCIDAALGIGIDITASFADCLNPVLF